MTEQEAAQTQWSAIWQNLPVEMKAGLAKLEAEHPGEILSAVSGGAVTAIPEGKELDAWMGELARAGGFGAMDDTARRFEVMNYWVDPVAPKANTAFNVGFEVRANQPTTGTWEALVTLYRGYGQEIAEMVSGTFTDVDQGAVVIPGLPDGQYTAVGYVNSGGVDPGSAPNEHGYRASFTFVFHVGEFEHSAAGLSAGGMGQLLEHLDALAAQLERTDELGDVPDLVAAVVADLEAVPIVADKLEVLAAARGIAVGRSTKEGVRLQPSSLIDASVALRNISIQLRNLQHSPEDRAIKGIVSAHIDEFKVRVEEAFVEENESPTAR
jgi:hypothetical protein